MHALAEEYARRTVQLRYDDALGTVEDERTTLGHVGYRAEIDVLHHHTEILVLVVGTVQLQLGLQGHAVRKAALETLLDRVTGRINIVIDELQNEVVPGVGDWKILLKHFVKAFVLAVLGRRVHLEKIAE